MIQIDATVARSALTEGPYFKFTGEASSMGFPPGTWPSSFQINDPQFGNGQPFLRTKYIFEGNDNDLVAVEYSQQCGCTYLRIYND
jgi:hypothetical protein